MAEKKTQRKRQQVPALTKEQHESIEAALAKPMPTKEKTKAPTLERMLRPHMKSIRLCLEKGNSWDQIASAINSCISTEFSPASLSTTYHAIRKKELKKQEAQKTEATVIVNSANQEPNNNVKKPSTTNK